MIKLPQETYVELYSELASYVESKVFPNRKTHDNDGNRLDETSDDFCDICSEVEEILCQFFEEKMERKLISDEELNNLLTEEVMDYWIGYEHKQARINLRDECKYDPKLLLDVLDHWKSSK